VSKEGGLSSQVLPVSDSPHGCRLLDQGLGQCESQQNCCVRLGMCLPWMILSLDVHHLVQHRVDTGGYPAIKQLPRRMPFSQREKVAELVKDMLEKGVIQPSTSAWASPIVLVPKRDGSLQFCVDYRKVNSITKKDVYPLPHIDDILDTLSEARYFSTLDLASGFWQIEMDPATREKSAFVTHWVA